MSEHEIGIAILVWVIGIGLCARNISWKLTQIRDELRNLNKGE